MNRLTKVVSIHNNEPEFYEANIDLYPKMMGYEHQQAEMDCINKLGQLEDIEEELGIDLITLFKALKQGGVYVKEGNKVDWSTKMHGFQISGISNSITLWSQVRLEPKDYGKTWALTREELENENSRNI